MFDLSKGYTVTTEFTVGPQQVEAVALMFGMSIYEVSLWLDNHILRSNN